MKMTGSSVAAILALAGLALVPQTAAAQQPPLMPGPAALSVPHPLPPPVSTLPEPPRDLYRQLTPPVTPPAVYAPAVVYGPFSSYSPYGPYGPYGYPYASAPQQPAPAIPVPTFARGGLRLDSSPESAQVYVDGFYVGVVEDFGISGRALDLGEGAHRVELRAAGYATLGFDVRIAANETTRYRGDLQKLSASPAVSAPAALPAIPRTTYLIPNCYAGDRPPSRALPPGCDLAKMIVRKP
jgi:hypothetical protein